MTRLLDWRAWRDCAVALGMIYGLILGSAVLEALLHG